MGSLAFSELYGVLGAVSFKDTTAALLMIHEEGKAQVADPEERAPAWTALGKPTDGNITDPSKVYWCAYFADREAYHVDHKQAQQKESRAGFLPKMNSLLLNGDMQKDFSGTFMGPMFHMESLRAVDEPKFAIVTRIRAKSEQHAIMVFEAAKTHAKQQVQQSGGNCVRVTVCPPGGESPEPEASTTVFTIQHWVTRERYENFIVMPGRTDRPAGLADCLEDQRSDLALLFFPKPLHLSSPL